MLSTALRNRQYPFSKCRLCKVLKGFFLVAQIRMLRRLLGLAKFFFICKVKVELIQHPKILVLGQGIKKSCLARWVSKCVNRQFRIHNEKKSYGIPFN